jgi:hypothetical protein
MEVNENIEKAPKKSKFVIATDSIQRQFQEIIELAD